jgi:sugar phosphate isomerase/epimerase
VRRPDHLGRLPALRATFDAANFVQCGVRPFTQARSCSGRTWSTCALAADGRVVPAGEGDGEVREILAALRDSGFDGFMSLEPHLACRFGGFSGPEAFTRAARALKYLLNELAIPYR